MRPPISSKFNVQASRSNEFGLYFLRMPFISVHVRKLVGSCYGAGVGPRNWW
jgi:hypothetical protein